MRNFDRRQQLSSKTLAIALALGITGGITSPASSRGKLIEQKPIFDTSVLPPSPFKLELKHTTLVFPEDLRLRNGAKMVNLQGNSSSVMLQGGLTSTATTTPILTIQRDVTAHFGLDLQKLIPKIAPDLSRQLEAQIDKSNRSLSARIAESGDDLKPSNPKLSPLTPSNAPTTPNLEAAIDRARSPQGQPQIPRSAPTTPPDLRPLAAHSSPPSINKPSVAKLPNGNLLGNGDMAGSGTMLGGGNMLGNGNLPPGSGNLPPGGGSTIPKPRKPQLPDLATQAKVATNHATEDLSGKLNPNKATTNTAIDLKPPNSTNTAIALKMPSPNDNDLSARLASQQAKAKLIAANTDPQLAALRAQAKRLPSMPSTQTDANGELLTGSNAVIWDAWHKRFAKLAGDALLAEVNKLNAPLGVDSVCVSVSVDNHLTVSLTKKSNPKFDQAVLNAYRSLNGKPALTFPTGSLRSSVSFIVENKHTAEGIASVVNSKTLSGDKEILHKQ